MKVRNPFQCPKRQQSWKKYKSISIDRKTRRNNSPGTAPGQNAGTGSSGESRWECREILHLHIASVTKKVKVCSTCGATHHVTHGHAHDRQCRSCDPAGPIVVDVTASARVGFVLGCAVDSFCETMQGQRCKIGLTRTRVRKGRCSSVLLSSTSGMPVGGGR